MYIKVYIYTWQEYTLNDQQIRAVAPIVYAVDEMWLKRTKSSSCKADGKRQERVNCLWLGAGGSGKTWAYTQVVRPVFRRFFGEDGFVAGAPTHAAVFIFEVAASRRTDAVLRIFGGSSGQASNVSRDTWR